MRLRTWKIVIASVIGLGVALGGARLAFGSAIIDSVSPAAAPNTGSMVLTVNGSGFLPFSTVRLVRSGQADVPGDNVILGSTGPYESPSRLRATFELATRSPGRWDVKATQADGTGTCAGCFSIAASKPTVSAVTPGSRGQGATNEELVITGTNFARGATVEVTGAGVTLGSPEFDTTSRLTVVAQIADDAVVGPRNITVRNTDGQTGVCANCFSVNGAPQITTVAPNSRGQGATNQDIVVQGSSFVTGATVSFGPDVTVNSTTVDGPGSLTANVSIGATAAPVARDVTVANGDGGTSDVCDNCFMVKRAPIVASAWPESLGQGADARTVTLTGNHFVDGATVAFSGSGITVNNVSHGDALELIANVSVDTGAAAGPRDIVVTNPDAGSSTCSNCFAVNGRPAVVSTTPSSRGQGAASGITVGGTGFAPGAVVSFGDGITVRTTTFMSATQLLTDVTVATTALSGPRAVTVTNSDGGTGSCAACFAVNTKPAVASVSPAALGQRAADKNVTITGSSFADGATVSFSGHGGITVNSVQFVSASTLVANVSISGTTGPGPHNVTVRNSDGATPATCSGCFTVNKAPSIATTGGLDPASRGRGATNHDITISGSDFVDGASVAFSGTGVSVGSVTFGNAQELTVKVSVAPDADLGTRDVVVTNPDSGNAACSACFTVAPAPSVNSTSPATAGQGASNLDVTVVGAGFADGSKTTFGVSDITVNSTTFTSPSSLLVNITINGDAVAGAHYVLVTNPNGGTGACESCFTVSAAPRVSSILPAQLNQGAENRVLALAGTFTDQTAVSFSGTGIALNSLTHQSATTMKANVSIAPTAATGSRNVTVTNPDGGRSVCAACFAIGDGPAVNGVSPAAAVNDGPITLTVDGAGFVAGSTAVLKFAGHPDIAGTAVTPQAGGNQLLATFDLNFVAPGARTLVVTAPGGASDECRCFAVAQSAPQLDSVAPSRIPQGAQDLAVTLNGSSFAPGASIAVSGSGVTVDSIDVQSPTVIKANVTVGSSAATGERDVTVTNTDGQDYRCNDCLTVNARPVIDSTQPAIDAQGATNRQLIINGDHFTDGSQVSFSGAGISVGAVQRTNDQLIVTYSIASDAAIGKRDITVTNPDTGSATCTECFTVKSAPTITSASPASLPQGASDQVITLSGTNFVEGAVVSFAGSGISVGSADGDASSLSATISIASTAATGARAVTVTNPDGGTVTCASCFTVNAKPSIASLSPAAADRGASGRVITLSGANFVNGSVVSFSGTGITTGPTTFVSPTTLRATISVASNAPLTPSDVTVQNPDEGTTTCAACFTVTAGQARPDFNGDGKRDIIWHNSQTGQVSIWLMNGTTFVSSVTPSGRSAMPVAWKIRGTGDFNADGKPDVVWHNTQTGQVQFWLMNGTAFVSSVTGSSANTAWTPGAIADYNADGKPDIFWVHTQGQLSIWLMNGTTYVSSATPSGRSSQPVAWKLRGTGDFNADGKADIVWHNPQTGQLQFWLMNGTAFVSSVTGSSANTAWTPGAIGDYNADGKPDILWVNTQGQLSIWLMNGTTYVSSATPSGRSSVSTAWTPA